jgi:hypothetical protein
MKELTDIAKANLKGLGRAHVQRWRLFVLLPLLLVAFGCGGGGGESETGQAAGTPQATGTALPDDLVGQWKTTLTYVPAYYTGIVPTSTSDFIGSLGITLYFQSNGGYQFDLSTAASYFGGNCFRTTQWSEIGRASIAGADITFTSTHATNLIMDSCGKAQYIDPAPTGTATYTMTREQDQTGWPMLRLRMPSGEDLVLKRCRDCG